MFYIVACFVGFVAFPFFISFYKERKAKKLKFSLEEYRLYEAIEILVYKKFYFGPVKNLEIDIEKEVYKKTLEILDLI